MLPCTARLKGNLLRYHQFCYYFILLLLLLLLLLHPFNGLFSRATWLTRYQEGKPFWILLEQEMMGVAVALAGPYANHLHLTADR